MSGEEAVSTEHSWTVERVLSWVIRDFSTRGIDSPRLEAELLLGHALGCSRIQLIMDRQRVLMPDELAIYRQLVARRRSREPVAYLRGEKEFYGLSFVVDRRVLVPRPDTEILVQAALDATRHCDMHGQMLDLCTGSGNVVLAFAKYRRTWQVTGADVSEQALSVARDNAVRLGLGWNARFVQSDLFGAFGQGQVFDVVTANAPYIETGQIVHLDADVRDFEPHLALDGGEDGLDIVRQIVRKAPTHLASGGCLALEVGQGQAETVQGLMNEVGFTNVVRVQDLGQRDRVVLGDWK